MRRHLIYLSAALSLLAACSADTNREQYPQDMKDTRRESRGSLLGTEGGFALLGGSEENEKAASGSPLGVNSFLWRATLDTLSFMPLASADPFGGVIITDWYEDPNIPGERYKVNALILDKTLRADGVRVTVFKQKASGALWRDLPVDERLGRSLEDTILTRARQMKIGQGK